MRTLTLLFSDIEGSTTRWSRFPHAMQAALKQHDDALRAVITQHGGVVFKTMGDAFYAVFEQPEAAVRAALASHRALAQFDFSAVEGLRVRIALHTGLVEERDGDIFGPQVNRTARLLSAAHGGQIVLSSVTADLLGHALPQDAHLTDLGTHKLKDIPEPEHVFQLCENDAQAEFPPLRAFSVHHNLPEEVTSFVPRDEVAQLIDLLRERRMVTLVGTGGIGKTRLAIHAARGILNVDHENVWFVDLAAIMKNDAIPDAIAAACEIRLQPGTDTYTALCNALYAVRALIILDNCEHLIEAVARVASTLMRTAPHIRLLATSRQPLGIEGENVFRLPSLSAEQSVQLFAQRASAADAAFRLTPQNRPVIEQICARLDGIALALELAAAQVRTLSLQRVMQLLDERFRVLSGSRLDALPRQQTMRALITWSYELLAEREQSLFRRLGIFSGGFSFEAAEAIADTDEGSDVFGILSSLVERSVVVLDRENDRYRLLESLRAYALEELQAFDEMEMAAKRHAEWVAHFARDARANRDNLLREADNVRAALAWCIAARNDLVLGAEILVDTDHIWHEFESEGARYTRASLEELNEEHHPVICGKLHRMLAVFNTGYERLEHALKAVELFERMNETTELAIALRSESTGLAQIGQGAASVAAAQRSVKILDDAGMRQTIAYAQSLMAVSTGLALNGQSDKNLLLEAIGIFQTLGAREEAASAAINLAEHEFRSGAIHEAEKVVTEAVNATQATFVHANALINRAAYRIALHHIRPAAGDLREAITQAHARGFVSYVNVGLQHAAAIAAIDGEIDKAAKLCGYVNAWMLREGMARESTEAYTYDLLLEALERTRTPEELQCLYEIGSRMTYDEAVTLFG